MKKLANIFIIIFLILFGSIIMVDVVCAQNNEDEIKAQHQFSKIKDYYRSRNTDSAFILAQDMLEYAKIESLSYYKAPC